jgi:hypothetical protein
MDFQDFKERAVAYMLAPFMLLAIGLSMLITKITGKD